MSAYKRVPSAVDEGGGESVRPEQTVSEMVEEVLRRQAKALVEQTDQSFKAAMDAVSNTDAGRQLRDLAEGPHREKRAREWQEGLAWERAEERDYTSSGLRVTWSGWKAKRREGSTTHFWRSLLA
jgi:hypothetical protein